MKKSLLALALIFGLVGALNAQDILALVTKGALSDNSKGVKVLSLDEMKQVKGGYLYKPFSAGWYANQGVPYPSSYSYNSSNPLLAQFGREVITGHTSPVRLPWDY